MAAKRKLELRRGEARVLVSPVRQELLSALGLHGPCSVGELARRLGRSATSLYYHLALLERVGAVAQRGRGSARTWRVLAESVTLAPDRDTSVAVAAAKAALRLTTRELERALVERGARAHTSGRKVLALRGKAWLDGTQLRTIRRHIDAINALLRGGGAARPGASIHAVTIVLAPLRERKEGR